MEKAGKQYALCHNGTVRSLIEEAKLRKTTDSEILLERLIEGAKHGSTDEIYASICRISAAEKYSSLTAFVLTQDSIIAWRIYGDKSAKDAGRCEQYHTLYSLTTEKNAILASEPLDGRDWELIPNKTFISLKPSQNGIQKKILQIK